MEPGLIWSSPGWDQLWFFFFFFFSFIFISWRLITSQHCSELGHTLTWISHGVTCIPHPNPLSHLPLHPIPLGLPNSDSWGDPQDNILLCPILLHYGLQHIRLPCPSPPPRVCSNSCPLSQWCHPTISSSVIPFSSYPPSFPGSGSFPVSQLSISGGQSIGASASVLPMNSQGWFLLRVADLIFLLSKGLSRVYSNTLVQKHQFLDAQPSFFFFFCAAFFMVQLSYLYMTARKTIALSRWTFVGYIHFHFKNEKLRQKG